MITFKSRAKKAAIQYISHKYATYVLVFLLISLLILTPEIYFFRKNSVGNNPLKNILLVQSFLLIPVVAFFKNLRAYYFLTAVFCSLIPLFLLPVLLIKQAVNANYILLALQSNTREIYELLGVTNLLLLVLAMIFCFWIVLRLSRLLPRRASFKRSALFSVAGLVLFMLLFFIEKDKLTSYPAQVKKDLSNYYPFKLAVNFYPVYRDLSAIDNYEENTAGFKFGVHKNAAVTRRTVQVLVIGESSRSDHWGINGYSRNTSPNLSIDSNIYSFKNVASGATVTMKAVPLLVTRVGIDDYAKGLKEKSILSAFKEAGFYTAWISNQYLDNKILKVSLHTTDADTVIATNDQKTDKQFLIPNLYDALVLKPIQQVISTHTGDVFMVIHLMGNHFDYKYRYPPSFKIFKDTGTLTGAKVNGYTQAEMINHYDNAVLYNDYVLQSIITYLRTVDANTSMLFVSDHGEDLNDNSNGLYYHIPTPSYHSAHVPLFIWLSNNIKQNLPGLAAVLKANEGKPVSAAESVFYTALNIGSVMLNNDENERRHCLASPVFIASSQRILGDNNSIYFFRDLLK